MFAKQLTYANVVASVLFHITYLLLNLVEKFVTKVHDMYFASIKSSQNEWLTQTSSFLMGDFLFILDGN